MNLLYAVRAHFYFYSSSLMSKKRRTKVLRKELLQYDVTTGGLKRSSTKEVSVENMAVIYCRVSDISQVTY